MREKTFLSNSWHFFAGDIPIRSVFKLLSVLLPDCTKISYCAPVMST